MSHHSRDSLLVQILAEHPLIVFVSVLGVSLISSYFITIFLVGLLLKVAAAPFHMYVSIVIAWLNYMPKISFASYYFS